MHVSNLFPAVYWISLSVCVCVLAGDGYHTYVCNCEMSGLESSELSFYRHQICRLLALEARYSVCL